MFLGSGPAFPLQTVFSLTSLGTVKQMEPTFTMHQCLSAHRQPGCRQMQPPRSPSARLCTWSMSYAEAAKWVRALLRGYCCLTVPQTARSPDKAAMRGQDQVRPSTECPQASDFHIAKYLPSVLACLSHKVTVDFTSLLPQQWQRWYVPIKKGLISYCPPGCSCSSVDRVLA